jgi:hypothetical protein
VIFVPPNGDKPVTKLRVTISTGDDDLRRNSTVSAFVILKDGRRIESKPLNCNAKQQQCAGLPPKSKKVLEWTVTPAKSFTAEQVHRFGLTFKSGKGGPAGTADHWDITAVSVDYVAGGTTTSLLSLHYHGRNYPLKNGESWESEPKRASRR